MLLLWDGLAWRNQCPGADVMDLLYPSTLFVSFNTFFNEYFDSTQYFQLFADKIPWKGNLFSFSWVCDWGGGDFFLQ